MKGEKKIWYYKNSERKLSFNADRNRNQDTMVDIYKTF